MAFCFYGRDPGGVFTVLRQDAGFEAEEPRVCPADRGPAEAQRAVGTRETFAGNRPGVSGEGRPRKDGPDTSGRNGLHGHTGQAGQEVTRGGGRGPWNSKGFAARALRNASEEVSGWDVNVQLR